MSSESLKMPVLYWQDLSAPGPMAQLETSRFVDEKLQEELGREPTPAEHQEAFTRALGKLTIEVTEDQRQEAVREARNMITQLEEFIQKHGGKNE